MTANDGTDTGNDQSDWVVIGASNSSPVVSNVVVRSSTNNDGDMDDTTAIGSDTLECTHVYADPDLDPDNLVHQLDG